MDWLQISFTTDQPDTAEDCLLEAGALAVTLSDAADPAEENPILEPAPGETPLWEKVTVTGLFPSDQAPEPVMDALQAWLSLARPPECTVSLLEDRDWVRAWMDRFEPLRFGTRLWVCPHHLQVDAANAVILRLDPGLAFGTGTHPTTALCLQWLADADLCGKTVIDYGCGSGILAIAAALLGAHEVIAVDIDPQAITATRDNAQRNHVLDRIAATTPAGLAETLHDDFNRADIVLANILAGPLRELADELLSLLKPGGDLVLAGLLDSQMDEVEQAYRQDIEWQPPASQDGWTRLNGRRINT